MKKDEKFTIERIIQDSENIEFDGRDKETFKSYFEFIKYFKKIEIIEKHHFIIGSNFSYGWMPRMLLLHKENFEEVVELCNKAKRGKLLDEEELENLVGMINNSLVGTSKLLHFINPNKYPIFDSKVSEYVYGKNKSTQIEKYLQLREESYKIINNKRFSKIHKDIINEIGYNITELRALDLIMYKKKSRR